MTKNNILNCPYHLCAPTILSNDFNACDLLGIDRSTPWWDLVARLRDAFPAAKLEIGKNLVFCQQCAKQNPNLSNDNVFGNGFADDNAANAINRWNAAASVC